MAKVTSRYTKDREGNWKMVPADYEHPITCKVCDRGSLQRKQAYRLGGPAVVIGYILLIPSVLAMTFWLAVGVLAIFVSTGPNDITPAARFLVGVFGSGVAIGAGVVAFIAGLLGWLLVMKKLSFSVQSAVPLSMPLDLAFSHLRTVTGEIVFQLWL
jgi:hypothetical protein